MNDGQTVSLEKSSKPIINWPCLLMHPQWISHSYKVRCVIGTGHDHSTKSLARTLTHSSDSYLFSWRIEFDDRNSILDGVISVGQKVWRGNGETTGGSWKSQKRLWRDGASTCGQSRNRSLTRKVEFLDIIQDSATRPELSESSHFEARTIGQELLKERIISPDVLASV